MTSVLLVLGLMFVGLGLLAIEVFVIPGFGVVGVLGLVSVAGSIYVAYARISAGYSVLALTGAVVGSVLMFWLLPKTGLGKSMVLSTAQQSGAVLPGLEQLLGREGKALTPLRPAGAVEIDERPVDVVTDGQYVEPGSRVKVVRVEGSRVVVEPLA